MVSRFSALCGLTSFNEDQRFGVIHFGEDRVKPLSVCIWVGISAGDTSRGLSNVEALCLFDFLCPWTFSVMSSEPPKTWEYGAGVLANVGLVLFHPILCVTLVPTSIPRSRPLDLYSLAGIAYPNLFVINFGSLPHVESHN